MWQNFKAQELISQKDNFNIHQEMKKNKDIVLLRDLNPTLSFAYPHICHFN